MTTEGPRETTAAVVLAAGAGSRFRGSEHKLVAELRGRPVLAHALDAAIAARLDETIVVVGAVDFGDLIPAGVTVLENPDWASGQATSVQVAIAHARRVGHAAVVVAPGDQPFVGVEAWRAVAASSGDLAMASFDGRLRPPTRLGASIWDDLPTVGDDGARVLSRSRPEGVTAVVCEGNPVDIDTVEDLARWN